MKKKEKNTNNKKRIQCVKALSLKPELISLLLQGWDPLICSLLCVESGFGGAVRGVMWISAFFLADLFWSGVVCTTRPDIA